MFTGVFNSLKVGMKIAWGKFVTKDLVDYNGHTNAGYGSLTPSKFFDRNHIFPGDFITVPRADVQLENTGL